VPQSLLRPNSFIRLSFSSPPSRTISYLVAAAAPVETRLFDDIQITRFMTGRPASPFGGLPQSMIHKQTVVIPTLGKWHLVIANRSDKPVVVDYRVEAM